MNGSTAAREFDADIIGSGINSLVAAAMLAKAGWSVGLFERAAALGGEGSFQPIRQSAAEGRCCSIRRERPPAAGSSGCSCWKCPIPCGATPAVESMSATGPGRKRSGRAVADRVQARIARHVEGLDELVLKRTTLSPGDLERENINLVGGDPYSGALDPEQNLLFRPLSVDAPHQTTVRRLFEIGASADPGPGLAAAPGTLIAKQLISAHSGMHHLLGQVRTLVHR